MPTKTGDKVRIIVLGTGPEADTARAIAESDADVALAKQFTKTVTHLVVDDTVKPSEARLKKAEESGVPVLTVAEFRALLVAGAEDETEESPAEVPAAEDAAGAAAVEEAVAAEPEPEPAPAVSAVEETATVKVEFPPAEPEAAAEPEPEPAAADAAAAAEDESASAPVAEAIDEPEAAQADPDKAVPSQADAPAVESTGAEDRSKPGLMAKLKSIFGLTGARK